MARESHVVLCSGPQFSEFASWDVGIDGRSAVAAFKVVIKEVSHGKKSFEDSLPVKVMLQRASSEEFLNGLPGRTREVFVTVMEKMGHRYRKADFLRAGNELGWTETYASWLWGDVVETYFLKGRDDREDVMGRYVTTQDLESFEERLTWMPKRMGVMSTAPAIDSLRELAQHLLASS